MWIRWVGGMAYVEPLRYEDVDSSANRAPTASSTSAFEVKALPHVVPFEPP